MAKLKCLFPDCEQHATARGLCQSHYAVATGYVRRGETTWDQLEANGKCRSKGIINRGHENREFFLNAPKLTD